MNVFSLEGHPPVTAPIVETVAFLYHWEPTGPWVLTAIWPDGGGIETAAFVPGQESALAKWIASRNAAANIYFTVNRLLPSFTDPLLARKPGDGIKGLKASKASVKEMGWIHTDIDPRPFSPGTFEGTDPLAWAYAEAKRARQRLYRFDPKPTAILNSGGGVQAFWRLSEPIPINGDPALAAAAEGYNLAIANALDGDHVQNCDRIMRLPGTVNWPDAKKRAKGRVPQRAGTVAFFPDRSYPASRFPQWSATPARSAATSSTVVLSATPKKLNSVDDLPEKVTPRTKMLIVQGNDPDDPSRYPSRSEACFAVCCELVRAGCTDDEIAATILDPDFKISAHVLHQPHPRDYAVRQIRRARDEATHPKLRELNDRHFVVENEGGKCRVGEWLGPDGMGRHRLSFQSFEDFRNRYLNQTISLGKDANGKEVIKRLGHWWLEQRDRRQFKEIVFDPDQPPEIDGAINLWRGFGLTPARGDWSLLRAHVEQVLADDNTLSARYILNWAAYAVQNPGRQLEVALVFKSGEGTGKGMFGRAMKTIFGQHGLQVSNAGQFAGRFNSHLRDVCLLFADDAAQPEDKQARGILKNLLTEPELTYEAKGRDIFTGPNRVKIIWASNEKWVVPMDDDDRRYAVFAVSERHKQDGDYFAALQHEMDNGGLAAMLHDLLAMDLKGWHPRQGIPDTKARNEQKAATLKGFEAVFLDLLQVGDLPEYDIFARGSPRQPFVATADLQEYAQKRLGRQDISLTSVGLLLNKLGAVKDRSARPSGYVLAPLADMRAAWDKTKSRVEWGDTEDTPEWCDAQPSDTPF